MLREVTETKNKNLQDFQKSIKSIKSMLDSLEEEIVTISKLPVGTNGEWLDEKDTMLYKYERSIQKKMTNVSNSAFEIIQGR